MRVLHLISSAGWYGAENVVVNLAAASRALGCEATVGVLRDARNPHTEVAEHALARGVPAEIIPCSGRLDLGAMADLRRRMARLQIDILHTHGYKANFYVRGAGLLRKFRVVTTIHTGTEQPVSSAFLRIYQRLEKGMLQRVDRVVAVSTGIADSLRAQGIAEPRLATICNGVDPARFRCPKRRLEGLPEHVKVVGIVGRLIREKGPYEMLQAARDIAGHLPDTLFAFVGDGPERAELERTAGAWRLGNHVRFLGVRSDMPAVYASLDAFALPSFSEGMPMTVLEAMAAGLPIMATRVGAVPQLLEPSSGVLCDPGDVSALTAGLLRILSDQPFAAQLGAAAQRRLLECYSAEAMALRYLQLYGEVAEKK